MERTTMADEIAKLTRYVASGIAADDDFFGDLDYFTWRRMLSSRYTDKVARAISIDRLSPDIPEKCLTSAAAFALRRMQKRIRFLQELCDGCYSCGHRVN